MLEKIKYVNCVNETIEFGTEPFYVNENDLRDFEWEIVSKNNKISGFKKGITKKSLTVIIKCENEAEGLAARNKLFEVLEKDVLANTSGKLLIGNYYMRCFFSGSKKSKYLIQNGYMRVKLTVHTDSAVWVKETTTIYSSRSKSADEFLDYPFDFSFDYKNSLRNSIIMNTALAAANFRIVIYGPVVYPVLYIGGHEYAVNVDVTDGEYLTIDSMEKTIVLTRVDGEKVKCLSKRKRGSYIFEKIPVGSSQITSPNQQLFFDITIFDERSEPEWI